MGSLNIFFLNFKIVNPNSLIHVFSGPQSVDLCQVKKPDDKEVDKKINSIFQESKYIFKKKMISR